MTEWKPPTQFDFSSPGTPTTPATPSTSSWSPPTQFDFKAPDDFKYQEPLYEGAGPLKSAGMYLMDTFNTYMGGAARRVESLGFLTQKFGSSIPIISQQVGMAEKIMAKIEGREERPVDQVFEESGQAARDLGKDSANYWFDKVSDGYSLATQSGINDENFGITTIVAGAAASLNDSMLSMGSGLVAGKLVALATKVGTSNVVAQAALGSVRAQRIMKWAGRAPALAGAVAGGLDEGAMAAGAAGVAIEERVMGMGHEELILGSPRYFEIWSAAEGMPKAEREKYAKTTLAEEAASSTAAWVGMSTAALGAPMGALAGHLGGKAVAGTAAGRAATWLESRMLGQVAVGVAGEGAQEFLQEGAEQFLQNLGIREYADAKQSLKEGVLDNAILGGMIGGIMGGALTPIGGAESRKNAKAELAGKKSGDTSTSTDADTGATTSRNPILEARITDLLGKVAQADIPAGEFMKVSRWAGHGQEGAAGGRTALEFAKALEYLVENKVASEDISAAVGEDMTPSGMLTEAAYKRDEKRFAFEAELRIKPTKEQVLPVLQELGANGANPYILSDGTLVIPQSAAGADGLAAVGKALEAKTGATVQFIRKSNENTAGAEAEVAAPAKSAVAEKPAPTEAAEGVLTSAPKRVELAAAATADMPVTVQRNATVVIEPGMAQGDAQAAIDAAGGVLAATHPDSAYSEPTDAQKAAGNYPKLPLLFKGEAPGESVRVVIENVPGSKRKSAPNTPKWSRIVRHHYGYIPGTKAADGDPVDIYVGRNSHDASLPLFVIRQMDPKTGAFDEPKVVMGYDSEGAAQAAYLSEYPRSMHAKLFGGITRMDRAQFNAWVKSGATDVAPDPLTKQPMLSLRRTTNENAEIGSAESGTPGNANGAREADARRLGEPAARVEGGPGKAGGEGARSEASEVTRTPQFKRWFGNSKAIDEKGEPKVVYHGTNWDVEEFMADNGANWFTEDAEHSNRYSIERADSVYREDGENEIGPNTVPVYLSVQNPLVLDFDMNDGPGKAMRVASKLGLKKSEYYKPDYAWELVASEEFASAAMASGYDSISVLEGGARTWGVFKSENIKSAIGNNGAFDREQPSILASLAPKFAQNKVKPNAVSVMGVHYSSVDGLEKLDPAQAGSGSAGGERRRMGMGTYGKNAKPGDIAHRLYFYEQTGKALPEKEGAVAGHIPYRVQLENIYDLANDPDDIYQVIADTYGPMTISNIDLIEETINELGYDGFVTDPQPGMKVRPIVLFGLKKSVPVQQVATPQFSLAKGPGTSSALLRGLTEQERKKITNAIAVKFIARLEQMPRADEYAAAAYAGRAKRGWYRKSTEAIATVFGPDAPRFAALLAAMSPQTSVQSNLRNALNTWANWGLVGRPTDRESIIDIMADSVEGQGGRVSVLNAWINNSERALTSENPVEIMLSGPKVDSFMRNLLGDVEALTLDTWMANFAAFDKMILRGAITKNDPGKRPSYLAMSARIREAAMRLSELTGETWTPAEVQETVWSWTKTLSEMAYSAGETRSAYDLVNDRAVTDELIASTPDFGNLLADHEFANILIEAGYEQQIEQIRGGRLAAEAAPAEPDVKGQTAPFDSETQVELERTVARRLDRRATDEALTQDEDYIPFSLAKKATPESFTLDLRNQVKLPGWAILTATRESQGAHDSDANKVANLALLQELDDNGIEYLTVEGVYKGADQGINYAIFVDERWAKQLGAKYGQESVLTNRGLVYTDGTNRIVPARHGSSVFGTDAKNEDFYSLVLPKGGGFRVPFSMGLDFDGIRQDAVQAQKLNSPDSIPRLMVMPGLYSAMYEAIQTEKGVPKLATAKQWSEWLDGAQRRGLFRAEERTWTQIDDMLAKREARAAERPTSRILQYAEGGARTLDTKTQAEIDLVLEEYPNAKLVTIDNAKIAIDDILATIEESYPEVEETILEGLTGEDRENAIDEMLRNEMDGWESPYHSYTREDDPVSIVKWADKSGIVHRLDDELDSTESADEFIKEEDPEGTMGYFVEAVERWSAYVSDGNHSERVGEQGEYGSYEEAGEAADEKLREMNDEAYSEHETDFRNEIEDDDIANFHRNYSGDVDTQPQYEEWTAPGGENYREILFNNPNYEYSAPHFGSGDNNEGLLMHARVKDRYDYDTNKKILFIEEQQSDLHQEARESGMMTHAEKESIEERLSEIDAEMEADIAKMAALIPKDRNGNLPLTGVMFMVKTLERNKFNVSEAAADFDAFAKEDSDGTANSAQLIAAMHEHEAEFEKLARNITELRDGKRELRTRADSAMEPAPFHKTWPEVLMKYLIRYAATNGYDAIAWTEGKQQAERYRGGVSQVVDQLTWVHESAMDDDHPDAGSAYTTGHLYGYKDGSEKLHYTFDKDFMSVSLINGESRSLKDIIGNDLASKIQAAPTGTHSLPTDQVIGGKGMVVQYDQIMPKAMEKLIKKMGGYVEKGANAGLPARTPGGTKAWRVNITEQMREALSQPLPAYSLAPEHDAGAGRLSEAQTVVSEVASKLRGMPAYTVAANDAHLPSHIRRQISSIGADGQVEGFFDPVSGRVFIVADNVQAREGETYRDAVERVFAEETLGHYGLRAVFGKTAINKLFDQVYRDFKNDARMLDIVNEYEEAYGDPTSSKDSARKMADEFLAKSNPSDQPGLWSTLVSWVREHLRNMGFVRKWNDNDIRNLMERVFDSVRTGVIPSGLQKLSAGIVTFEGTDVSTVSVRDGSGMRTTTERADGIRSVGTLKFEAGIIDGEFDGVPAAEISAFSGSVGELAKFVGAEGKLRIVASLSTIGESAAKSSGFPYRIEDSAVIIEVPKVSEKSVVFSLRNRAHGSDDVEAILEKSVQPAATDMSVGQKLQKMFHEMTGYFGASDTWLELKTGWIDSATALEKLERGQFGGKLLDAAESAYKMVNLTRNLPQIVAAVSKMGVPVYRDGSFVRQAGRKGLFDIFAPLWKTEDGLNLQYLWEGYAVARRSSQLINEINPDGTSKEKLLSPDEIDKLLELEVAHPEFKKVFDDWQQFNRELLDLAVDRGTMSEETAEMWKRNDYVPFFRVEEEEEVVAGIKRSRGISGQKVTSKRLTGSDRRIQPVLENIVMNTAAILEKVYKNEAMNRVVALADGVAMTRAPNHMEAVKLNNADIARQLVKAGLFMGDHSNNTSEQRRAGRLLRDKDIDYAIQVVERMSPEQREAWTTFFRPARPEGNDIVSVMVAGKAVYYRVSDPLVLRSIMDMTPTNFGGLVNLMGGAKRLLTTMVTLDPGFMLRNYLRDTLSSWTTVNEDFIPLSGAIGDAVSIWTDEGITEDIAMAGGMVGGFYNPTQDFGDVMQRVTHSGGTIINGVRATVDSYRKIGRLSEQLNRVAIARAVLRRGGSLAEAAYQSQDVMNFSQHGDAVAAQLLMRTVPFLNARIQGLYRLWKGAKGLDGIDPKRARMGFMMKFLGIGMASMLLALRNADDERYEQIPDDQKDIYWHIFIGDHHFAIPKPFEVGVLSATIPERLVRRMQGQDKTRTTMQSVERALLDTFAFNPIPQLFKPMVEQWANRTFFGQRPIVGQEIDNLEPVAQYNPWTSETARGVATIIDQVVPDPMKRYVPGTFRSPVRLEHAMRAYMGTIGSYMLQLSDAALRQGGVFPEAPAMRDVRDVPVIGTVAGSFYRGDSELDSRSKYADDLYDALKEADAAYGTVNAYLNRGEVEKAEKLVNSKLDPLTVRPVLHEFREQASDLNTLQRQVLASDMTPTEKREALDEIARAKNKLMRQAHPYLGMMDW